MTYPLEGIKVLDFSRVLAGPFAGRMLCDLGADVVKVEPPEGDITRYWGHVVGDLPGYFHQQNVGKRNICIDLRADGAVDLVKSLVEEADILIENYRPDVMPRLGLGYSTLAEVNPRLIMLSISGFGHDGPESRRAAYAPVIHAEVGLLHRMARRNQVKPHDLPLAVADTNASLHGLVGVLAALYMRQGTGKGQHLDIAMTDATLATDDQLHYDLEGAQGSGPLPNDIWELPFGTVLISADIRYLFQQLNRVLGMADPATPEMSLEDKIAARRKSVTDFLNGLDTRQKFTDAFNTMNIAWGDVRDPVAIREQPTVKARGSIAEVDDRAGGTRPVTQSPYRFSNAESGVRGPASHRGEDYQAVLSDWLGMDDATIRQQIERKLVLWDPDWKHH